MRLGCFLYLVAIGLGAASATWGWSFWWAIAAAFLAACLHVAGGPAYDTVRTANREGRLSVMPRVVAMHILPPLALAGISYWIARVIAG